MVNCIEPRISHQKGDVNNKSLTVKVEPITIGRFDTSSLTSEENNSTRNERAKFDDNYEDKGLMQEDTDGNYEHEWNKVIVTKNWTIDKDNKGVGNNTDTQSLVIHPPNDRQAMVYRDGYPDFSNQRRHTVHSSSRLHEGHNSSTYYTTTSNLSELKCSMTTVVFPHFGWLWVASPNPQLELLHHMDYEEIAAA